MKHRILCALLCAALLLPTLGCAGGSGTPETSTPVSAQATTVPEAPENTEAPGTDASVISPALPAVTYDGYEFTVGCYDDDVLDAIYAEEQSGETVNDAIYDRNLLIEDTYGVKVSGVSLSGDFAAGISAAVSSDEDAYALISGHDCTLWGLTLRGYFHDLRQMPHMDFSQPWYPSYANDTYCIGGRQYMFTSYLSYLALSWAQCILINKTIAEDNGLEIPYASVLDGTWTLDAMIDMTKGIANDLNGDGVWDASDRYGMASGYKMYSFQGSYLDCYARGEDGRITLDFDRDRLVSLCEKMVAFMTGPDAYITGAEPHTANTMFINGQSLFNYSKLQAMTTFELRDSNVEYGVLPIPKWNTEQENYVSGTSDRQFAALITNDETERIGVITEALSSAGYSILREAYFDTALSTKFTPDRESVQMLSIISDTLAVDLSFLNTESGVVGLGRTLMYALSAKTTALSSYLAKITRAEQKTVDKINSFYFGAE